MNIALSILSNAAEGSVIDRLQAYTGNESQTIAQQQISDPGYWSSVLIITLTGILVVFLILAILILFFGLLGIIFKSIDNKRKAKENAAKEAAAKAAEASASNVEMIVADDEADDESADEVDDAEVIAVISAAIAAYSEQDGTAYSIRSIKRKDNRTRSAWSLAGIGENTRPF